MMIIRPYNPAKDRDAVRRIWREVGWIQKDKEQHVDKLMESCKTFVAEIDGEAECSVTSAPGKMKYLNEELPFTACTSATTSRVARKQGALKKSLVELIASDVAEGAVIAGLGVFDQGFYDRLGFGTGSYEHWISFDPLALKVSVRSRMPRRLTQDDWELIFNSRMARKQGHGSVSFYSMAVATQELIWAQDGFGLGYSDGPNGELTHHIWVSTERGERGPYTINWLAYQTREQLLELLGLLKSLGDQVYLIRMREPAGVQLQALIDRPFRRAEITENSKFENRINASAYWQMRITDLNGCLAQTHLQDGPLRFNLKLRDPIEFHLPDNSEWKGIGGEYIVTLGPSSSAERGHDEGLPTLDASVNSFTRLWLGVGSATNLSYTDDLLGPAELLAKLDEVLRLPSPHPDWDF